IGSLNILAEDDPEAKLRNAAFKQSLQQLGWTEGRNVRIEERWAGGDAGRTCPLLGVKRTLIRETTTSANDPKRTSCHGAKARICLGLGIVVNPPQGATCSDAVEADSR